MVTKDKIRPLTVPLLLTGIIILVFHRFWNHSFVYSDTFRYFAPSKFLVAEALKKGTIYAWNPWLFLGMPFVGESQAGWFYPLNFLCLITPFELGYRLFILVHFPMAAMFMYLFLRGRAIGRESSFVGAVVFVLSGYMTSQSAYLGILISSAWAPLALYCIDRSIGGSKSWAAGAGAVISMQVFAGEPQIAAITGLLIGLICFTNAMTAVRRRPAIYSLLAAFISTVILSALQSLPMIEMVRASLRGSGMSFNDCALFSFHPARFIEIIWPLPFGTLWPEAYYWGRFALDKTSAYPWTFTNYIGLPVFALALLGMWRSRKPWRVWLRLGLVFFFIIAMGRHTPVFGILYRYFPFFSSFRYPEKYMAFFAGFVSVAAALGFEETLRLVAEKPSAIIKGALFYGLLVIAGAIIALFAWPLVASRVTPLEPGTEEYQLILSNLMTGGRQWLAVNLIAALIAFLTAKRMIPISRAVLLFVLVLVLDFYLTNVSSIPSGPKDIYDFPSLAAAKISPSGTPQLGQFRINKNPSKLPDAKPFFPNLTAFERGARWGRTVLDYNLHAMAGFESFKGYNALSPAEGTDLLIRPLNTKIQKLYNVAYLITDYQRRALFEDASTQTLFGNPDLDLAIIHFTDAWPRAYWAPYARTVSSEKDAIAELAETDMRKYAILTTGENIQVADAGDRTIVQAIIKDYRPDDVVIESNVDAPGWLVLSDRYFPGWTATVDGQAAPIYKANVMVRAVKIPAGKHTVVFNYRPKWFRIGAAISIPAWILVLSWWVVACVKSRKPSHDPT